MMRVLLQIAPLHTADDMRAMSNFAHVMEGAALGLASLAALVESRSPADSRWPKLVWPVLIGAAGVALLFYLLFPHHGLEHTRAQWEFIFGDSQQRQHLLLAALSLAAGLAETLYRVKRLDVWGAQLLWPAVLLAAGVIFAAHPQHGTSESVRTAFLIHQGLAAFLIAAAVLRVADLRAGTKRRWLGTAWPMTLLAASILLLVYREPKGAYEMHVPRYSHDKRTP